MTAQGKIRNPDAESQRIETLFSMAISQMLAAVVLLRLLLVKCSMGGSPEALVPIAIDRPQRLSHFLTLA